MSLYLPFPDLKTVLIEGKIDDAVDAAALIHGGMHLAANPDSMMLFIRIPMLQVYSYEHASIVAQEGVPMLRVEDLHPSDRLPMIRGVAVHLESSPEEISDSAEVLRQLASFLTQFQDRTAEVMELIEAASDVRIVWGYLQRAMSFVHCVQHVIPLNLQCRRANRGLRRWNARMMSRLEVAEQRAKK